MHGARTNQHASTFVGVVKSSLSSYKKEDVVSRHLFVPTVLQRYPMCVERSLSSIKSAEFAWMGGGICSH